MNWTDPNPIFFDIETQSAVELSETGGRAYALHPTTRVLSLVARVDSVYHVWIPSYIKRPREFNAEANLWPAQLGDAQPIQLHHTPTLPDPIRLAANAGRTFIAHNAWGFDQFIWRYKIADAASRKSFEGSFIIASPTGSYGTGQSVGDGQTPVIAIPPFLDSMPIMRAAGLAGGLEGAAKAIFGGEKDKAKSILRKFWKMKPYQSCPGELYYPEPNGGEIAAIARYNVADVVLLARLWEEVDGEIEADVLAADCAINERGVALDAPLTRKIEAVARVSVGRAAAKIALLTATEAHPEGELNATNLGSADKVKAWLGTKGLRILSYQTYAEDDKKGHKAGERKASLRKDLVEQAIANPWLMLEDDAPVSAAGEISPIVFEVLRLRSASLRITSAKANRAILRTGLDGRARDLFQYWQAHTGRWSSAGIQVHNLPRAKKGVPLAELLAWHELGETNPLAGGIAGWQVECTQAQNEANYDHIAAMLPAGLSVDDALSSLLRPIFMAAPGKRLLIADYNAIECRGVAWIAGEEALLQAFREGRDPYVEMACRIFHCSPGEVDDVRRQIGKVAILGLGYGMGVEKFRVWCGLSGVDLQAAGISGEVVVDAYKQSYPAIAGKWAGSITGRAYRAGGVWDKLGRAAMLAISEGGMYEAGKCVFYMKGTTLVCGLPSGRKLRYHGARIEDRVPGYAKALGLDKTKATIIYDSPRGEQMLYGGKITENVVQAICRDVFADAIVRMEKVEAFQGVPIYPVVMHGHDEIQSEVDESAAESLVQEFADKMATVPPWASGFPLGVEAYISGRNLKRSKSQKAYVGRG